MYAYDELDRTLIRERVSEFRDQVKRGLSGELTEDEFKMLRLQNGVYLQLHAYMFRVAIPYGTLSSKQLRAFAHVARRYDRGYGHFTTRQNIQFNWIKLAELPDALEDLAKVGIHAMQTSGNNMRNVTSDQWAGVAPGEVEEEWQPLHDSALTLQVSDIEEIRSRFSYPHYEKMPHMPDELKQAAHDPSFERWRKNSAFPHKVQGYSIVTLSLKPVGGPPGDATADQMDVVADLADSYSFDEIRVGHEQNLVLPHVVKRDLPQLCKVL